MTKGTIINGFIWRFLERCGAQGVTLIVSIVLARLLNPDLYGTISLIMVFITIMEVFVDSGFGNALIQKKDADETDFSSVFYFNLFFGITLYLLMFLIAPAIANFYSNSAFTAYIRVLSIVVVIASVKNIQIAYVSRNMLFKKFFFATIIGTVISGFIGILMAYYGFGVWAIIVQNLSNTFLDTCILWITVKWRPTKKFCYNRFIKLYAFAWKLLVTSLIDTAYQKIRQLIIGKIYSTSDLAYYNQGQQLPYAIISNLNASIDSVLLPSISSAQDNVSKVKNMTRQSISLGVYIISPLLLGLFAVSETLVSVLLTDKWLPCVFYLRVACASYVFTPINTANLNAIKALGRSDIVLKLEIYKKIIGCSILLFTVFLSVRWIAIGLLISAVISQIINSLPNKKLMNYGYFEQIKDIIPQIGISVLMGAIVYCVQFIGLNDILTLSIQIPVGAIIYIVLSKVFHIDSFEYLVYTVKGLFHKQKKEA